VQDDDVAGLDPLLQLSKRFFEGLAVAGSGRLLQLLPVAGLAVKQVMDALVTAKNSRLPSRTTQRVSMPAPVR
jgi:hypothetical protein